jgi:hypothetical protein
MASAHWLTNYNLGKASRVLARLGQRILIGANHQKVGLKIEKLPTEKAPFQ